TGLPKDSLSDSLSRYQVDRTGCRSRMTLKVRTMRAASCSGPSGRACHVARARRGLGHRSWHSCFFLLLRRSASLSLRIVALSHRPYDSYHRSYQRTLSSAFSPVLRRRRLARVLSLVPCNGIDPVLIHHHWLIAVRCFAGNERD